MSFSKGTGLYILPRHLFDKAIFADTDQGTASWLSNFIERAFRHRHSSLLDKSGFWLSLASCGAWLSGPK
jgi:hypothetical protein